MAHTTVLLKETIDALDLQAKIEAARAGDHHVPVIVDGTINGGGHSEELVKRRGPNVHIIGIDLDSAALGKANIRLEQAGGERGGVKFNLVNDSFRNVDKALMQLGITAIDGMILDLGLSSNQFDESGRGFSFQKDEPLLMTFRAELGELDITADRIVNHWEEENIADVIYAYGEEQFARRIARRIVEVREKGPIKTTSQLVEVIRSAVPFFYQHGKTHFATKTFQALRITANDEVGALKEGLLKGFGRLRSGGRMAVISFHSIEDRIVKRFIQTKEQEGYAKIITKKPITPSFAELQENPRARSAKLRIVERI